MIKCKVCHQKKKNKEFKKDIFDEYSDTCKECEEELEMDSEDREGMDEIAEHINND